MGDPQETGKKAPNPFTKARWDALSPLVQGMICLILSAAEAGHLNFKMGEVVIRIADYRATTLHPSPELRPGYELPQGAGGPFRRERVVLYRRPYKEGNISEKPLSASEQPADTDDS